MSELTFLEQFAAKYAWDQAPAKRRFRFRKRVNRGMEEGHRLALTLGGVIDRALDDDEGLQSSDYSTYQIFEKDDLVFKLIDLENIKTSRVGYVPRRGIMSPAYIRLQPSSTMTHSRYYYWFFYGAYLNNIFNGMGGGVRQNLTPTDLLEFPVPLPDLETQKAIADFLDRETARIDQLIEKKQRLVELGQIKLEAEIHRSIANSDAVVSQPLHRFCKIVTGKTPSRADEGNFDTEQGLPWATPTNLGYFEPILSTKEMLTEDGIQGQIIVPKDTVLINGIGASIGKVGFSGCTMSFNQQIHGIIQRQKILLDRFLFFVMLTRRAEIFSLASNTTIPIINADRFGRISVPMPPKESQAKVVERIESIVAQAGKLGSSVSLSIERLREFRSALITAAVTGQIDVATWGKQGQTDCRLDKIEEAMQA